MGGTYSTNRASGQGGDGRGPVGVETYIDVTIVSGVLTGLVIAMVAAWIWHFYGRLWRHTIGASSAEALDEAATMGLRVRPAAGRAGWLATGKLDGITVRIAWMGGIRGERTSINIGSHHRVVPLVTTGLLLREVLSAGEE